MAHRFGKHLLAALALSSAVFALPATAQVDGSAPMQAAMEKAAELGHRMYLYDQAAWHGSDALAEDINMTADHGLRGYVVEQLDNGNLSTLFYAEDEDGLYEFARYEVNGSKVVGGGKLPSEVRIALSPKLIRMASARQHAIDEAVRQEWGLCTPSQPNFIIFPPDADDLVTVYIISSTTDAAMVPFGGHYRVRLDREGMVVSSRAFTNSCLNMRLVDEDGNRSVGIAVTHLLDPHPTEIHFFQSYYARAAVVVAIAGDVTQIVNGEIAAPSE